jgi:ferredoxin
LAEEFGHVPDRYVTASFWRVFHGTLEWEATMPKLMVEGTGTVEVPAGKLVVLALEDEAQIDQLHGCGGNARCTTYRVEFIAGEPATMTAAEQSVLATRGLTGVRLSCQILCDHDMTVRAISRLADSGRAVASPRPADSRLWPQSSSILTGTAGLVKVALPFHGSAHDLHVL